MRTWVDVAVLAKTRNLQGGFVAQSVADLPFLLTEGMEVALVPPVTDAPRRVEVSSVQNRDERSCVVEFDAIDHIDVAEMLVGCHCLVRRGDLATGALAPVDAPWDGWSVYDVHAGLLGVVEGIVEGPGQDLLSVVSTAAATLRRPILIPLVDEFLRDVDEAGRRIEVDVPSGLLDL